MDQIRCKKGQRTANTPILFEHRIARQHQQLNTNTLFTIGRAGQKRLAECVWEGTYTGKIKDAKGYNKVEYRIDAESTRTMNGHDQDLFFAILYMHRMYNKHISVDGEDLALKSTGATALGQHIKLTVSGRELLTLLGWDTSERGYKRLLESLDRLARVYMVCKTQDKDSKRCWSSHLLNYAYTKCQHSDKKQLNITVATLLAVAAYSQKGAVHSSHSLTERLELKQPQKVLHGAICSRIRPGYQQRYNTCTLLQYMYGEIRLSAKQKCLGIQHIRDLGDLDGWTVRYQADSNSWLVYRPKLK